MPLTFKQKWTPQWKRENIPRTKNQMHGIKSCTSTPMGVPNRGPPPMLSMVLSLWLIGWWHVVYSSSGSKPAIHIRLLSSERSFGRRLFLQTPLSIGRASILTWELLISLQNERIGHVEIQLPDPSFPWNLPPGKSQDTPYILHSIWSCRNWWVSSKVYGHL